MGKKLNKYIVPKVANATMGYPEAQAHYQNLKKRFLQELEMNLKKQGLEEVQQEIQLIEKRLLQKIQADTPKKLTEKSTALLNTIGKRFATSVHSALQEHSSVIKDSYDDTLPHTKDEIKVAAHAIEKVLSAKEDFNFNPRKMLLEALGSIHSGVGEDALEIRYQAFLNQAHSISRLAIRNYLHKQGEFSIYGMPSITLGGLVAEDIVWAANNKVNKQMQLLNILPGGAKRDREGRQTHMDIILSMIDWTQDNFNTQLQLTSEIPAIANQKLYNEWLQQINYFGEQIKTLTLTRRSNTGNILGKRITSNTDLLNAANSENIHTLQQNIRFMGRYAHILKSFGADTLLIRTNDGGYYVDEFIRDFRQRQYFLMLGYTNVDKNPQLTSTIVIDKPYWKGTKKYSDYKHVT